MPPKRKVMARSEMKKPEQVTDREWEKFLQATADSSTEWVLVTPDDAQEWLSVNTKNRRLSSHTVDFYANQIKTGDWMANGQPIIFGKNGKLLDGQHRLAAIIQAGRAAPSLVVRGVDNDAFKSIDRGRPRSIADILHMQGEINSVIAACASRYLDSFWRTGHFGKGKGRIAFNEIESIIRKHPNLRTSIHFAAQNIHSFPLGSPSLLAATHYLFNSIDEENCKYFFDRLLTGAELAKDSPILQLRNLINKNAQSVQKYPLDNIGRFVVKAWNLFCLGEPKSVLRVDDREDLSLIERPVGSIHGRGK